jgi:two-component system, chemotaxis family, CheB/CheR fusion protein
MKKRLKRAPKRTTQQSKTRRPSKNSPRGSKPATPTAPIGSPAREVLEAARALYGQAHRLDVQADALHAGIEATHTTAAWLHGQTAGPISQPADLVVADENGRKGKPFPIVGIGASAGGFEAFAEFLRNIPKDSGMAFVLVQHLDPTHKSQLSQLLSRCATIPVKEARREMEVEPGCIYVIPENADMTLVNGRLRLQNRKETGRPPMPIDVFFRSLAEQQQSRAIGVVLSGTGCDGTLGLEAIKGEGGITFAQDDRSSRFHGMPASAIGSGAVDFVLSPAEIAQELGRLSEHPLVGRPPRAAAAATVEATHLETVLDEGQSQISTLFRLLRARTGVDFSLYKQSTLKRRIMRRMILHKKDRLKQYTKFAEGNAAELDALFNDLLINVTSFFRDPQTFALLKRKIFPRIIKAHAGDGPLRFWVCGCSGGEEAYSLAISLVEYFEQTRNHRQAQIFATDISEIGIERARAGIYPPNIQQDVSPERLRRFFTKINGKYQVHKSIRDMCVFARQNVLVDPPFSNLDMVSCRNVLIYFGPLLQRRVIPLFHYSLRNTGFLLLGSSETIGASTEHFAVLDKKHKIYVKKAGYLRPEFAMRHKVPEIQAKEMPRGETAGARENRPVDLQQHLDRLVLREFSPPMVVVNTHLDVIHFRGRTAPYLEHAPGSASLNLFKMIHPDLSVSVRAAVSKAQRQEAPVTHAGIEQRRDGHVFELKIEVVPIRIEALDERFYAIVFRETELPAAPEAGGRDRSSSSAARARRELARMKLDLLATKESMQSIIEEQEGTNEELKSANEEIQSSNEELQSTNEELETAKEELQSTNEELTTLNEELQNRNSELSQVNNDLLNLLASVNLPILMVGNDLTIRRFTPMAERLFSLIPSDVGRRLSDMNRTILLPELDQDMREVIDELKIVEKETQDRDGHWYLLRIRPYRTRENKIDGAVIVLIDIDEIRQALGMVMGMVHQPLLMLGLDLKVRSANEAFLKEFGLKSEDAVGRLVYELKGGEWDLPQLRNLLEELRTRKRQVNDFVVEGHFGEQGFRKLKVSASRFSEEGKGIPLILLAVGEEGG